MKKILSLGVLFVSITAGIGAAEPVVKNGTEVFEKWIFWQRAIEDIKPKDMAKTIEKDGGVFLKEYRTKYQNLVSPYQGCLQGLSFGMGDNQLVLQPQNKKMIKQIYESFDHDIGGLLGLFEKQGFIQEAVNQEEKGLVVNSAVQRYRLFLKMFFASPDPVKRYQYCFSVANRMFRYCFDDKTFPEFKDVLYDEHKHQLARFCYSTMWYYLVGEGWKHWHNDCLNNVIADAKKGKEVVYIAGGSDIYQLLKNGVHNIRVIDPLLPSQPDYYSEGWNWLAQGTIGDKLNIDIDNGKKIVLKRDKYEARGTFKAKLSTGATVDLPNSVTQWSVYDGNEKKQTGKVVFERRYCQQGDFVYDKKKSMLISFNEMYFVSIPPKLQGWGIDVTKFHKKFQFHVKQLSVPVSKSVLCNVCKSEDAPFTYILLGSCAT